MFGCRTSLINPRAPTRPSRNTRGRLLEDCDESTFQRNSFSISLTATKPPRLYPRWRWWMEANRSGGGKNLTRKLFGKSVVSSIVLVPTRHRTLHPLTARDARRIHPVAEARPVPTRLDELPLCKHCNPLLSGISENQVAEVGMCKEKPTNHIHDEKGLCAEIYTW